MQGDGPPRGFAPPCASNITVEYALVTVMRKVTKAERLLNEQMLALLDWASEHPKQWHDNGKLAKRGVIEIRDPMINTDSIMTGSSPGC
jgi:hypothetical protein